MSHNWRAEGRLQPCWFQIRGVQQTGMQTRHQRAKNMHIINTSYCHVEILTLHFEVFGSFSKSPSAMGHCCSTLPLVFRYKLHHWWWFYVQLMPGTCARFVYKKIWKQRTCTVNHCCKNNIQHWCDYYLITGNEKYLERVRYDLQALVWD